jgi:NTE family protein
MKKYKIGIALGGGGSRGFAHLGVLKALNERGIYPEIISGTSAGSIVGSLYAAGYTPDEIHVLLKKKKFADLTKIHIPTDGLFSLDNLTTELKKAIPNDSFEDLKIPFIACVANLNTGKAEYIDSGPLHIIVQASSSIPVLFSPVKIGNTYYVDGGLIDNLPVRPLVRKCDHIIGVNIFPNEITDKIDNLFQVATRTFQISLDNNTRYNKSKCKVFIEPADISKYHMLETKFNDEVFEIGYQYCKKMKIRLKA